MKKETAQKAAKWWADRLRSPAKLDNGDDSSTGAMTLMMATMLQTKERTRLDTAKIDAFEKELTQLILDSGYLTISVDYGPDWMLMQASEKAGLDLGMCTLPWKTTMWLNRDDTIKVAEGYRAEAVEI